MFPAAENRPLEMRNVWQARKTMVAANTATRYQVFSTRALESQVRIVVLNWVIFLDYCGAWSRGP